MINISHILEGWGNKVKDKLNLLDEHTKKNFTTKTSYM